MHACLCRRKQRHIVIRRAARSQSLSSLINSVKISVQIRTRKLVLFPDMENDCHTSFATPNEGMFSYWHRRRHHDKTRLEAKWKICAPLWQVQAEYGAPGLWQKSEQIRSFRAVLTSFVFKPPTCPHDNSTHLTNIKEFCVVAGAGQCISGWESTPFHCHSATFGFERLDLRFDSKAPPHHQSQVTNKQWPAVPPKAVKIEIWWPTCVREDSLGSLAQGYYAPPTTCRHAWLVGFGFLTKRNLALSPGKKLISWTPINTTTQGPRNQNWRKSL